MKWIRSLFGWTCVRDTLVHRYYEHRDGRRKVERVNFLLHQPVDRQWLDGGEWRSSRDVKPPPGRSAVRRAR